MLGASAAASVLAASRLVDGGSANPWAAVALFVGARAVSSQAFRLDRLQWRDWTRDDDFIWHAAVLSGSVIAVLAAGPLGVDLPLSVTTVDMLLFLQCRLLAAARTAKIAETPAPDRQPTLIYGAGRQGRLLLDELRRAGSGFEPIGWLDDDPDKAEAVLSGLPVLGPIRSLPFLAELHGVETVFTAIPSFSGDRSELAEEMAAMAHVRLCVAPTLRDALRSLAHEQIPA